jgi:hypothetical protein
MQSLIEPTGPYILPDAPILLSKRDMGLICITAGSIKTAKSELEIVVGQAFQPAVRLESLTYRGDQNGGSEFENGSSEGGGTFFWVDGRPEARRLAGGFTAASGLAGAGEPASRDMVAVASKGAVTGLPSSSTPVKRATDCSA